MPEIPGFLLADWILVAISVESYSDLAAAREEITGKVYDIYGYWLEQEPVEIINPPKQTHGVN